MANTDQADTDGDLVGDGCDTDDDGDFCSDTSELRAPAGSELSGGRRDPANRWDYFNTSHDGMNRVDDILLVVPAYCKDSTDPAYNEDTDRTYVGPVGWNLGPPNGQQRVDDILNAVKQYLHDCG